MGKMKRPKNKKREYIDSDNLVYYDDFFYDDDDETKLLCYKQPKCAHDIEAFFNEVAQKKNFIDKEELVYKIYTFVKMVKPTRVDLLRSTITRLSEMPDIFKGKNYFDALTPLYVAFALNFKLSEFKTCRYITIDMRTAMLKDLIDKLMYVIDNNPNTYELFKSNIKYLLKTYTYYSNDSDKELLNFDLLFSDTEDLRSFLYAVLSIYDKKRAFEIIYMIYHDYVKLDDDLTEAMMIYIPKQFVRRLIFPWYSIYKFIIHPIKFLQKEI